ncbi:MAG: DUF2726 domain-containing protein [Clostridia bacterium]|nr:DUF2726 domain-containing protein [Clostridia bacterium]
MKNGNAQRLGAAAAGIIFLGVGIAFAVHFTDAGRYVGIALAVLGGILVLYGAVRREEYTTAKYVRKKSLVTAAECEFLQTLRRIAPNRYEVLPQCVLASVIDKRTETTYRNELFRIVDYVFVDKVTYAPLLLVELNDSSHNRADRKQRDAKVNEICRKAKLPLVTFTPQQTKDYALVKKTVLSEILKR